MAADDFDQLWAQLAPIGRTATGGYERFAWTSVDAELRSWFTTAARQRGLAVGTDRNGNLWAWWGRPGPGAVVTGSHLDSVPDGGAYDGPLGVVSGLLAVDDLRARGVIPRRPLAVVVFADEEGARFGVACVGSRLLTGSLDPDAARALAGPRRHDAGAGDGGGRARPRRAGPRRRPAGRHGRVRRAARRAGPGARAAGAGHRRGPGTGTPVGVGSAIWPHGRWRCSFTGRADHAGTTRLADRSDPVLPFAATALAARDAAAQVGGLATFGRVHVVPGGTNVIASRVDAWLDARSPDEATLHELVQAVTDAGGKAALEHGVDLSVTAESASPAVGFALRDRVAAVLDGAPVLATGAGHDAGVLAAHVPTAMIFVRNPTGTSHSPAEAADREDCLAGVRALSAVLEDLLAEDPPRHAPVPT